MNYGILKLMALLAALSALAVAVVGCGAGGSSDSGGVDNSAVVGCLSPGEVREEVNRIAEGVESSPGDVEAKQEAIRVEEAEAC